MKMLLLISMLVLLSGCGWFERISSSIVGGGTTMCYKGVEYVQFTSGAVLARNRSGNVIECGK